MATGRASWRGTPWTNDRVSGTEAANDGVGEPWPDVQQAAYAALNAANCDVFGFDERDVADHKEIAVPKGRKIDRTGVDPVAWRDRVRLVRAQPDPREWDEMATRTRSSRPSARSQPKTPTPTPMSPAAGRQLLVYASEGLAVWIRNPAVLGPIAARHGVRRTPLTDAEAASLEIVG